MDSGTLKIATCQFGVSADIEQNAKKIRDFIAQAADGGADIVHFSECAISGYAGVDFPDLKGYNWDLLRRETEGIIELSGEKRIWVVLGSMHRLTEPNKPFNCLYLIGPAGEIVDRYDKRFCTPLDMGNYSAGNRFVYFEINGVKCSLLICFDLRFPEIYRRLYKAGVQCVLQSFYNARQNGPSVHSEIMRQTVQCRAASNFMWISMTNSSAWFCPYPSCFIQPDGRIVQQLEEHREGMMINTVDTNSEFYDPMKGFREMAMDGKLSNGDCIIGDQRADERKVL